MDLFEAVTQALGFGLAAGLLVAAVSVLAPAGRGALRAGLIVVAVAIGAAAGLLAASTAGESAVSGCVAGAAGALVAWIVAAPILAAAGRRTGEGEAGGLVLYAAGAALIIAALAFLFGPLALPIALSFLYLGSARRRRDARKHAGLRVLR